MDQAETPKVEEPSEPEAVSAPPAVRAQADDESPAGADRGVLCASSPTYDRSLLGVVAPGRQLPCATVRSTRLTRGTRLAVHQAVRFQRPAIVAENPLTFRDLSFNPESDEADPARD